eukprot:m.73003 g.73003  ORF g.73003 m.73003 type:complete len:96 (+) comp11764_c0_seq3:777-1064(+)
MQFIFFSVAVSCLFPIVFGLFSLRFYMYIDKYCTSHPDYLGFRVRPCNTKEISLFLLFFSSPLHTHLYYSLCLLKTELELAREMITLLPAQINML